MNTIDGGLLVAIEGIDGAGKTTLAASLEQHFRGKGVAVVASKEPTQGVWGQALRETAQSGRLSPQRELELLLLDRREHVDTLIQPALQRGALVLLDRYYFSSAAYQGAAGLDPAAVMAENEAFAPRPHLTILLDLPPTVGLNRIHLRGDLANAFEREDALTAAREIFLTVLPKEPAGAVLDALQPAEAVLRQALGLVLGAAANKLAAGHGATPAAAERLLALMGGPHG